MFKIKYKSFFLMIFLDTSKTKLFHQRFKCKCCFIHLFFNNLTNDASFFLLNLNYFFNKILN